MEIPLSNASPNDLKKFKENAKILAKKPKENKYEEYIEFVEFLITNEHYGIESCYVHEVYPIKEITPVPCTPSYVLGIINVRGKIISIINLKKFFDFHEKGLSDFNKVIIVYNDIMEFGILADEVFGMGKIPKKKLQASLPTLTGVRSEYLKGVTNERLVILDAEKILSDSNIIVHEEV